MRPYPRPYPPTTRLELWVAAAPWFEYGEQQSQLRQQAKRMAYSELLNVHEWVDGGWGGGGGGAAKVSPMLGVDTQCQPTPPMVAVNVWRHATHHTTSPRQ